MRNKLTPETWSNHIEAQPDSGKTVKSYCDDHGLDLSSFYRQRRNQAEHDAGSGSQEFVQAATALPRSVSASCLTIQVRDFTVTLDSGPEDLERVLLAMAKVQHVLRPE